MRCPHCQLEFAPPEDAPEGRLFCPGCGRDLVQDTKETVVTSGVEDAPEPTEESGSEGTLRIDAEGKLSLETKEATELGSYRVIGSLGRGAMGVVYLAEHVKLGRKVALKILPPGLAGDAEFVERFRREAASASKLDHPGIVKIFGADEALGTHYYAMQYIEGESLRGETPEFREAARITKDCAEALAYAHRSGVIHRDVKPENILLRREDRAPLIADFGLAREENVQTLTRSGQIVGTPAYMAPEQAEGSRSVDGRADQYALGATLYELLAGARVFDAPDMRALLFKVVMEDPVPLRRVRPEVPRDLETITMKCLEKRPDLRYPSCAAMAEDLGRFLAGEPISAKPLGLPSRLWRKARKHKAVLLAVLLALAALGTGGGFALQARFANRRIREEREAKYRAAMDQGRDAFTAGTFEKATEAFLEALTHREGDPEAARWKTRARVEGLVEEGRAALERKDWGLALECLERVRRLEPDHPGLRALLREARRLGRLWIRGLEAAGPLRGVILKLDPAEEQEVEIDRFDSPPGAMDLAEGVYILELNVKSMMPLRYPVKVNAGETVETAPPMVEEGEAPPGMVLVPAGPFQSGDEQILLKEKRLGAYFIDREEVSIKAYRKFVEAAPDDEARGWRTPEPWREEPPDPSMDDLPVTGVTWEQAYEYARWASKHLPSDLEWEKAARGIDGRAFPWGSTFDRRRCNSPVDTEGRPVNTGSFPRGASPYGVLDMSGNVAEWTASDVRLGGAEVGDGRIKVMGGSFADAGADAVKASSFRGLRPKRSGMDVGFRCAKFLPPSAKKGPPRPWPPPGEIPLAESFRVVDDERLEGTRRFRVTNPGTEPMDRWRTGMEFLTAVTAVTDERDENRRYEEEARSMTSGRRVDVALDPPLEPGRDATVVLHLRSLLFGMPRFFRRSDRFRVEHWPPVEPGMRYALRLVLPPDASIERIDPPPHGRAENEEGLELFWDVEKVPERRGEGPLLRFRVDYRREGVDPRFEERERFMEERTRRETGPADFDPRRHLERFSKHFANEQGVGFEMLQRLFESRKTMISRMDHRIDFRSVEIFGDFASSVEAVSARIWDHDGKLIADMKDMVMQVVCVREEGIWKHLFDISAPRPSRGIIDENAHTYVNDRYKCRFRPLPGWTMQRKDSVEGFALVLTRPGREGTVVILSASTQPKDRSLEELFRTNIETVTALVDDFESSPIVETTVAGAPALSADLVFSMCLADAKIFSHQRRFMAIKNRLLYVLFEITQGKSAEKVKRVRSETEDLFREVREALVIE
ncbi:MAG: protein kinase domain-containing protein [Planctomycetota bacterium]